MLKKYVTKSAARPKIPIGLPPLPAGEGTEGLGVGNLGDKTTQKLMVENPPSSAAPSD